MSRAQAAPQRRFQVGEHDRLLQRAEHVQPLRATDLLRSGQHALIHATRDQHVRLAAAFAEIAQQFDTVGAGHLQIEHDDGRLEILHGAPERIGSVTAALRIPSPRRPRK